MNPDKSLQSGKTPDEFSCGLPYDRMSSAMDALRNVPLAGLTVRDVIRIVDTYTRMHSDKIMWEDECASNADALEEILRNIA